MRRDSIFYALVKPFCVPFVNRVAQPPVEAQNDRWLLYFLQNRERRSPLPWHDATPLTKAELATIAHSVRTFQLGECSEGTHLIRLARDHANRTGDRHWVDVIKLFIGEEQYHAHLLERFMALHQIQTAPHHWSDTAFRKLRRFANLEVALTVLLTAELFATLYYPALGQATRSPLLNALCTQIYQDEVQHVEFQTESLGHLRGHQPIWRGALADIAHQLFFRLTLLVVWGDHRPVFRASGYRFYDFYRQACQALNNTRNAIRAVPASGQSVSANLPRP